MIRRILLITILLTLNVIAFSTDTSLIRLDLIEDITTTEITITNNEKEKITLSLIPKNIDFEVSPNKIILNPNEKENIILNFKKDSLGLTTGRLLINEKQIPIILESETKDKTFNVITSLPISSLKPNKKLKTNIKVFTLKNILSSNLKLTYIIKDFNNNLILKQEENLVVNKEKEFEKEINIPPYLKEGNYVIATIVDYNNQISISSDTFDITTKSILKEPYTLFIISILIILAILLKISHDHKHLKKIEIYQKKELVKIAKIKSKQQRTNKLKKQLSLLEQAYSQHYISKNSYIKTKNKINKLLKK